MAQNTQNPSAEHPNHPFRNFLYILACALFTVGFSGVFLSLAYRDTLTDAIGAFGATALPIVCVAVVVIAVYFGIVTPVKKQKRFLRRNK